MTDLSAQKAHRDYVSGVLFYYQQNDIQPGDPNEGIWEEAHYPEPKRLGGTETVWLLKQHHAVQGVLQSEEYQCCCVSGDYMKYVRGTEYEKRMSWWLGENWRNLNRAEFWTDERRAQHSKAQRKRFKEQPVSDETRAKQSAVRKGVPLGPFTKEHCANIQAALATPESKTKRSIAAKQSRINNPEIYTDGYIVYDTHTRVTTVYPSRKSCSKGLNMNMDTITWATRALAAVPRTANSSHPETERYLIKKQKYSAADLERSEKAIKKKKPKRKAKPIPKGKKSRKDAGKARRKPIEVITPNQEIKQYDCIHLLIEDYPNINLSHSKLAEVARGSRNHHHGFKVKYV